MSLTPRGGGFTTLYSREDSILHGTGAFAASSRRVPVHCGVQVPLGEWTRCWRSLPVDSGSVDPNLLLPHVAVEIP